MGDKTTGSCIKLMGFLIDTWMFEILA